jgi:pullulanase/glycogen debranching enzyme
MCSQHRGISRRRLQPVDRPTYGIDNSSYYALDPQDMSRYVNHSACGNDLRTAHPVARQLVVDSLRYWARNMGVDGFRFDLASLRSLRGQTTATSTSKTRRSFPRSVATPTSPMCG